MVRNTASRPILDSDASLARMAYAKSVFELHLEAGDPRILKILMDRFRDMMQHCTKEASRRRYFLNEVSIVGPIIESIVQQGPMEWRWAPLRDFHFELVAWKAATARPTEVPSTTDPEEVSRSDDCSHCIRDL